MNIDNILFENVEIFCDRGRAINVKSEDEKAAPTHVTNVRFKNITYTSAMKNQLYSPAGDYVQNITLENVKANGKLIAPGDDFTNYFDITGEGNISAVK